MNATDKGKQRRTDVGMVSALILLSGWRGN
jgi:hypothetical protein